MSEKQNDKAAYEKFNFWSFSEVTNGIVSGTGKYDTESVPTSLLKNEKFGLELTVFEADFSSEDINWSPNDDACDAYDDDDDEKIY